MGATLWRRSGQLWVTVIVKSTFALIPNGDMTLVDPVEVRRVEAHYGDNPARSVRASSDIAPYLEAVDILFVGHAYPPGGVPAPGVTARLGVVRGSWSLLDKIIEVHGDRASSPGQPPSDPRPFQKMPLVYERAYGGIGSSENPLGVALPNLLYADPARRAEPAGFGPISCYWPLRKRLLRGYSRQLLDLRIAEIPDEFDAAYFQAAPPDQRIPSLQGDELIILQGLHPAHPSLTTRLPGARAMARVYTGGGMGRPFALNAGTLFIDGDAERCSITWRGSFPVSGEESLASLTVVGGIELPGAGIEWPDRPIPSRPRPLAPPPPRATPLLFEEHSVDGTALLREEPRPLPAAMPFQSPAPGAARHPGPPRPSAPPPPPRKPIPLPDNPMEGTVLLQEDGENNGAAPTSVPNPFPAQRAPVPPRPSRPPPSPPRATSSEESAFEGTVMLVDQGAAAARPISAPFKITTPSAPRPASGAPIPGAPWSGGPAPEVPRQDSPFEGTASVAIPGRDARKPHERVPVSSYEDSATRVVPARAAKPAGPPPEAKGESALAAEPANEPEPVRAPAPKLDPSPEKSAEEPADKPEKPAWSWATPTPDPAAAETSAPAPPPKRPAAPPVKNKLYGKFVPPKK